MARPTDWTIDIDVDADGNFKYSHSSLRMNPGETVVWNCANGSFTVGFTRKSPLDKAILRGKSGGVMPKNNLRPAVKPGVYKYAAAVARVENGQIEVYIDANCPEIIVGV